MALTVTYNNTRPFTHIFTTTGGGTVFSASQHGSIAFDLFANNAVVNDAIYFGTTYGYICFGDIEMNIGTAFAATSVTFIWEYWTGSWRPIVSGTDNTAGFTTLGATSYQFNPRLQTGWTTATINAVQGMYVRCRITAINTPTEGGRTQTTQVVFRDNAIRMVDATAAVNNDWCAAAYAADVAGGWGVVTRMGRNTTGGYAYYFNCHIALGASAADAGVTVVQQKMTSMIFEGSLMNYKNGSQMIFGEVINATNKTSKNGCYVRGLRSLHRLFADSPDGSMKFYVYSSLLDITLYVIVQSWNNILNTSQFNGVDPYTVPSTAHSSSRNTCQTARPDWIGNSSGSGAEVLDVMTIGATNAMRGEWEDWVRGLKSPDATAIGDNSNATNKNDMVLVDCVLPNWKMSYAIVPQDGTRGQKAIRLNSMNIKVVDDTGNPITGATITVKDKNGNDAAFKDTQNWISAYATPQISGTWIDVPAACYAMVAIGDVIKLGGEWCLVTNKTNGNRFTITRAQYGSEAHTLQYLDRIQLQTRTVITDANGLSGEYLVESNNYGWLSGTGVQAKEVNLNPFTITVSATGYETYTKIMTIAELIDETIQLKPQITKFEDDNGNVFDRVDKTNSGTTNLRRKIVKV